MKTMRWAALAAVGMLCAGATAYAQPKKNQLDAPTLDCVTSTGASIDVEVCAGPSGAPAGFSLQWITLEQYQLGPDGIAGTADDNSWPPSDDPGLCKASFSGVPGCSDYNLAPFECTIVNIGDRLFDECGVSSNCPSTPLECDTDYVFRAFAHNVPGGLKRSDFTPNLVCATQECGGGDCTYTQGYWKNHFEDWPADVLLNGMMLGDWPYDAQELLDIFNTPAAGNGLIQLAHQLIAAKLNIANGADPTAIQASVDAADFLIGDLIIPPVGAGSLAPALTSALTDALAAYNEGGTGPGHCP